MRLQPFFDPALERHQHATGDGWRRHEFDRVLLADADQAHRRRCAAAPALDRCQFHNLGGDRRERLPAHAFGIVDLALLPDVRRWRRRLRRGLRQWRLGRRRLDRNRWQDRTRHRATRRAFLAPCGRRTERQGHEDEAAAGNACGMIAAGCLKAPMRPPPAFQV